jgi:23S rRNA (uracil1939-C5)-methyltransferase
MADALRRVKAAPVRRFVRRAVVPTVMSIAPEVTAAELDDDGAGVAVVDGVTVHVAGLAPGERATVRTTHASPHRAERWATVVERRGAPSPDRVTPACPAFGRCGGCPWQHLAYPAQLGWKRRRVVAAVGELAEVAEVVRSPAELGYRHKGKYVAGRTVGHLALGAWAPRSHDFVDTAGCRAVTPTIDRVRGAIVAAAADHRLAPADERRGTGDLRYAIVRQGDGGQVLVGLVVRSAADAGRVAAAAAAIAAAPAVAGVVRLDNDRTDGALLDGAARPLVGAASLSLTLAGVAVDLGATEFAQINPAQAEAMYRHVAALAEVGPGDRAADVYAGLGGIAFALAASGAEVLAIERDPAAVAALTAAAHRAGRSDVTALAGDAERLADHPDVAAVVIDPPRKGASPALLAAISASRARTLIYVSCGPDALGRDLRALVAAGWRLDQVTPFDLMPGTAQVETVVRLRR